MFEDIFAQIPRPALESLTTDGDRLAWAEIYSEAAKIPGADATFFRKEALRCYDSIVRPADFHLQRRAELLIDMGRAVEAETILLDLVAKKSTEWIERLLARTRLALGDPKNALTRIDMALSLLEAEHFRSEFLELRYDIRLSLGELGALEDLERAVEASQKTAEKQRLADRFSIRPARHGQPVGTMVG